MHLTYAIPDHPWVESASGAAVRIAMTVGAPGAGEGRLQTVVREGDNDGEAVAVALTERTGHIHADLRIGADVAGAKGLRANAGISSPGFKLHGAGFIVTPAEAECLLPSPSGGGAGGEGARVDKPTVAPSSVPTAMAATSPTSPGAWGSSTSTA